MNIREVQIQWVPSEEEEQVAHKHIRERIRVAQGGREGRVGENRVKEASRERQTRKTIVVSWKFVIAKSSGPAHGKLSRRHLTEDEGTNGVSLW